MPKIESSHIHAVDHTGSDLVVTYKGKNGEPGAVWVWRGVPRFLYDEMLTGGEYGSVGRYLNERIKPYYKGEKR